jgi:tetratricopeptide (TPR) repeat protein
MIYDTLGDEGEDTLREAFELFRQRDVRREGAMVRWNLGLALEKEGDLARAAELMQVYVDYQREIGHPDAEKRAAYVAQLRRWNLGLALEKEGDLARAAELMQIYVDYLREIGHPDAEKREARLEDLRQRLGASQNPPPAEAPDEE